MYERPFNYSFFPCGTWTVRQWISLADENSWRSFDSFVGGNTTISTWRRHLSWSRTWIPSESYTDPGVLLPCRLGQLERYELVSGGRYASRSGWTIHANYPHFLQSGWKTLRLSGINWMSWNSRPSLKWKSGRPVSLPSLNTFFSDVDWDEDLSLSGFGNLFCLDQSPEITGKSRRGGVCFYVNESYCNMVKVRERMHNCSWIKGCSKCAS